LNSGLPKDMVLLDAICLGLVGAVIGDSAIICLPSNGDPGCCIEAGSERRVHESLTVGLRSCTVFAEYKIFAVGMVALRTPRVSELVIFEKVAPVEEARGRLIGDLFTDIVLVISRSGESLNASSPTGDSMECAVNGSSEASGVVAVC